MIAPKTLRTSFFLQRATALQGFDLSIARAVAETRTLAELSLPLVRIGGHLVAAKGPNPQVVVHAFCLQVIARKHGTELFQSQNGYSPCC